MGDLTTATLLAQESLRIFTELEDTHYLPDAQLTLAQIAMDQGAYETAVSLAALAHDHYAVRDDAAPMAGALLVQAELAEKMGDRETAVTLLARSRALRQSVQRAISPREQAQYDLLACLLETGD